MRHLIAALGIIAATPAAAVEQWLCLSVSKHGTVSSARYNNHGTWMVSPKTEEKMAEERQWWKDNFGIDYDASPLKLMVVTNTERLVVAVHTVGESVGDIGAPLVSTISINKETGHYREVSTHASKGPIAWHDEGECELISQ